MKKKQKKKIHPYTEESLSIKDKQLKLMISFIELLLLYPIINSAIGYLNIKNINPIIILLVCIILFLFLYTLKIKSKKFKFSKWDFLDDEFSIITDRKLDGEISNIYITKYILIIICNILIIIPICLTFSAIISSIVTLIIGFIIQDINIINIIKFILIFIIFKSFFAPINKIFIDYIKEKELD